MRDVREGIQGPMIIILEGVNGTGKSEAAKLLSSITGMPIWRPFRTSPDIHWNHNDDDIGRTLRELGVPLNTFCDDLYVADALRTLRDSSVILDRSMLSAFAYSALQGESWIKDAEVSDWVWRYWEESLLLRGNDVLVVYLRTQYETSKARCEGRWHPNKTEWAHLVRLYEKLLRRTRIPARVFDTEMFTTEDVVNRILRANEV